MNEKKNSAKSSTLGKLTGAKKNDCYGNSVGVLQFCATGQPDGWFYIEGIISAPNEAKGEHHGWVVNGTDLIDPTEPSANLIYQELKRWPAADLLELIKQDLLFPLTDESGAIRDQSSLQMTSRDRS